MQRLLDIETYRTTAMLGLPLAQTLSPEIRRIEDGLTAVTQRMKAHAREESDEMLAEITRLAAELEANAALSLYRFGASRAYDGIVRERIKTLDETPVPGHETLGSFLERRLAPAMRTCQSIEERQANPVAPTGPQQSNVSYPGSAAMKVYRLAAWPELRGPHARIAYRRLLSEMSQRHLTVAQLAESSGLRRQEVQAFVEWLDERGLLSTRVDITRERQNQALLASMDRRARLQLRLQQTVEGLSVAAISYYVVGLIGYAAKAISHDILPVDPAVITGVAVPFAVLGVWWVVRRIRKSHEDEH